MKTTRCRVLISLLMLSSFLVGTSVVVPKPYSTVVSLFSMITIIAVIIAYIRGEKKEEKKKKQT